MWFKRTLLFFVLLTASCSEQVVENKEVESPTPRPSQEPQTTPTISPEEIQTLENVMQMVDPKFSERKELLERHQMYAKKFSQGRRTSESMKEFFDSSLDIVVDYANLNPEEFNLRYTAASSVFAAGFTAPNAGIDGEEDFERGHGLTIELVADFPRRWQSHALMGRVLLEYKKDLEGAKAAFTECLNLYSEAPYCSKSLKSLNQTSTSANNLIK